MVWRYVVLGLRAASCLDTNLPSTALFKTDLRTFLTSFLGNKQDRRQKYKSTKTRSTRKQRARIPLNIHLLQPILS